MVKSGPAMQELIEQVLGDVRPEAVYFTVADGQRTVFMVADIEEASDLVRLCEPLWLAVEADVDLYPVMTAEDLEKAGPVIGQIASKY